jgi:hypothetical protein
LREHVKILECEEPEEIPRPAMDEDLIVPIIPNLAGRDSAGVFESVAV